MTALLNPGLGSLHLTYLSVCYTNKGSAMNGRMCGHVGHVWVWACYVAVGMYGSEVYSMWACIYSTCIILAVVHGLEDLKDYTTSQLGLIFYYRILQINCVTEHFSTRSTFHTHERERETDSHCPYKDRAHSCIVLLQDSRK